MNAPALLQWLSNESASALSSYVSSRFAGLRRILNKETYHQCESCNLMFAKKDKLVGHIAKYHTVHCNFELNPTYFLQLKNNNYLCPCCFESNSDIRFLNQHLLELSPIIKGGTKGLHL